MNSSELNIAVVIAARPSSGGLTTFVNTICGPLRNYFRRVDLITLSGVVQQIDPKDTIVKKTQGVFRALPGAVFTAYLLIKILLLLRLLWACVLRRYDVFFTMSVPAARVVSLVCRRRHKALVLRVGGIMTADVLSRKWTKDGSLLHRYLLREERLAFGRADLVLPNSVEMARCVLTICPEARVCEPIGNPVGQQFSGVSDSERTQMRERLGLDQNTFVVLCPSLHLERRKGPMLAVKAIHEAVKVGDRDYCLVLCGHGPEEVEITRYVKQHRLENTVRMQGVIPHEDLLTWYNVADATLFPVIRSGGMAEDSSNCVLESMACGTPVVVTAFGSFKTLIRDGENGFLFPEGNVAELSKKIRMLHDDPEVCSKISRTALGTIDESCRLGYVVERLSDILCNTVKCVRGLADQRVIGVMKR